MSQASHTYLIVGDDPYLLERATKEIVGDLDPLSVTEFGPQGSIGTIIQTLRTGSLLADRRTVIVRGMEELPAESIRQLIGYIEDPVATTTVVFISLKALPKVAAAVKKSGRVIDASRGKRADLTGWIREESKSRGLKIDQATAAALLDAIGEERLALSNALEELALAIPHGGKIGVGEVRTHFHDHADTKIFTFIDAAANRDVGVALHTLHLLLRQGESPQAIFWMLLKHIRMLLLADSSPVNVARRLGIPDWRAEKLSRQARNFTQDQLIRVYSAFAEGDRKMKNSEEAPELTLERIVLEIAGLKGETTSGSPRRY